MKLPIYWLDWKWQAGGSSCTYDWGVAAGAEEKWKFSLWLSLLSREGSCFKGHGEL